MPDSSIIPLFTQVTKAIIITGGTGGIGYEEALMLAAGCPPREAYYCITGRDEMCDSPPHKDPTRRSKTSYSCESFPFCSVLYLTINPDPLGSEQRPARQQWLPSRSRRATPTSTRHSQMQMPTVQSLAKDLLDRSQVIDELINNAGHITAQGQFMANDDKPVSPQEGVEKNLAVNVMKPVLLTRLLVPALLAASHTGRSQITSGGLAGMDDIDMANITASKVTAGIPHYSRTKRAMKRGAVSLNREMQSKGIAVNVVGGGAPGATAMTSVVTFSDLSCFLQACYCLFTCIMRPDGRNSAKNCGKP